MTMSVAETIPSAHPAAASFAEDAGRIMPSAYPEQIEMAVMMHDTMVDEQGVVGLIEAPTATGKTLVMAHNALRHAVTTGSPIVIATPSVELCHQTAQTIRRLKDANPDYARIRLNVALGRQEYMSPQGVQAFADTEETDNPEGARAIRDWLADGAPGITPESPRYTKKGLELSLDRSGARVRSIPQWATLAHHGTDDPAQEEYLRGFDAADVVVATHAMLARDIIKRYLSASSLRKAAGIRTRHRGDDWWIEAARERLHFEAEAEGRLCDYRHLIVDEAHLLHENVSNAMTTSFSIRHAIANVGEIHAANTRNVPSWVLPRLTEIRDVLSDHALGGKGKRLRVSWTDDQGFDDILTILREALDAVKEPKDTGLGEAFGEIKRARHALRQALAMRDGVETMVEWSPRHTYPSISVGPRSVRAEMHFLWGRLKAVCLVSATLYAENRGGPSAKWITEPLGIGPDAIRAWPPIRAEWTTANVLLRTPSGESAKQLTPPAHGKPDDEWIAALAEAIDAVQSQETEKGVLVLTNTRSVTTRLCQALRDRAVDEARIIDGTADRMGANRVRFERDARLGRRPIWIAQGPAWTGLDLADDTLGALVVTRLPFPPPRAGTTAGEAATYDGTKTNDMLMRLKQGMGRLVRTRRPSPKRAYVLDGRLVGSTVAAGANTLLDGYARETF